MSRERNVVAGAVALVTIAALAACNPTKDLVVPTPPVDPLFASYVSLGNSISAGFQSGGINDSTQHQAYPVLLAAQMNTPFTIPSLVDPGCPPPIDSFPEGTRVGGGTSTTCAFRAQTSGVAVLNNVAVPGAASFDPSSPIGTGGGGALTTFILGGKTQVQRALDARPTFVSIWIGNNDVLPAALSGVLDSVPGLSPGVTSEAAFEKNYNSMMSALGASTTIKGGILIGVVNVAAAPVFFPAAAVFAPGVLPALEFAVGAPITVDTSCTPLTQSIINFQLLQAMHAGTAPDTIACHALANHANGLGEVFVLDANEIAAVSEAVAGYNAFIQQTATSKGWAFVDPNPTLLQLRETGQIPTLPDLTQPTKAFGDFISLDGIHPAAAAHMMLANLMIQAINSQYSTNIPSLATP
jgi:lysophospholipase L1-like esterase